MSAILKQHYVVVSDPIAAQNDTAFGVKVWMFTADRKQVRTFWWGTGNCLIGNVFTEEYHRKRVKEVVRALTQARQVANGELQAAADVNGEIKNVDAVTNSVVILVGWAKDAKEREFKLSADTTLLLANNELRDVQPLADGLKSPLCQLGALVQLTTITDKGGTQKVQELRITGKNPFRSRSEK